METSNCRRICQLLKFGSDGATLLVNFSLTLLRTAVQKLGSGAYGEVHSQNVHGSLHSGRGARCICATTRLMDRRPSQHRHDVRLQRISCRWL